MCGKQNLPMGSTACNECGQSLRIECPGCNVLVINTKRCSNCGADLHPAKPATPAKPKPPEYKLSVVVSGKAGKYTLAIQVLKDGQPVAKDAEIVAIWDGAIKELKTGDNGFISHSVNFTSNELRVTVTLTGTDKSWSQKLVGASFKPAGGFIASLLGAIGYYRGQ
jgi:hypothetical protein